MTATTTHTRRPGVRLTRTACLPPHAAGLVARLVAWGAAALDLDLVDLVAAGDALVHHELCTLPGLIAFTQRATGRGCRAIRQAAALVRERVGSIPETRLRICLLLSGLPERAATSCWVTTGGWPAGWTCSSRSSA